MDLQSMCGDNLSTCFDSWQQALMHKIFTLSPTKITSSYKKSFVILKVAKLIDLFEQRVYTGSGDLCLGHDFFNVMCEQY